MRTRMACWLIMILAASAPALAANPSFPDALRAAKAGDARSQYIVGMMYLFGDGTKASPTEGARWIETSARTGMPQALVAMATLLDIGHGVPLDVDRATQLRTQAASAGNPTARAQLEADRKQPGTHDFRRADALDDFHRYADAFPYAKRSAEAGHPDGMDLLGRAYLMGHGTAKNDALALQWFRKAEAAGSMGGARSMGYVYEFGRGVAVNRKEALKYYDRAAARGSDIAKQAAANLRSPDYDQPPPQPSGGNGITYCTLPYVYDFSMGYCRAQSTSDPPNMQHDSGPH
ncbi:MAG: tetratricopeptide repeat protein [Steroidobacteraceae bacterium]